MKQEQLDLTRLFALAEILQHTEFRDWCGSVRTCAERLSAIPARDEAALADLALDYLHLAQPEFCSARCPSVGREGEPIPHLPECVSMRSLLDRLPFATPGATISTGLMAKLKKLANYLTEQGEYEACDLIDTVVDRLSASPPTPARDDGWMPIETAPKDGETHIIAYPVLLDRACVVIWEKPARTPPMMRIVSNERHDHNGYWRCAMSLERSPYQPTHWRPLPAPPAPAQEPRK